MTSIELANDYKYRAKCERDAGGCISITWLLPSVHIIMSDDSDYYYQEWQADSLINNARDYLMNAALTDLVSIEDYLLAYFQNA